MFICRVYLHPYVLQGFEGQDLLGLVHCFACYNDCVVAFLTSRIPSMSGRFWRGFVVSKVFYRAAWCTVKCWRSCHTWTSMLAPLSCYLAVSALPGSQWLIGCRTIGPLTRAPHKRWLGHLWLKIPLQGKKSQVPSQIRQLLYQWCQQDTGPMVALVADFQYLCFSFFVFDVGYTYNIKYSHFASLIISFSMVIEIRCSISMPGLFTQCFSLPGMQGRPIHNSTGLGRQKVESWWCPARREVLRQGHHGADLKRLAVLHVWNRIRISAECAQ